MDKNYFSLKDKFGLRFRIALLTTLILLILGFIFFPKIEQNTESSDTEITESKKIKNIRGLEPIIVDPEPLNIDKLNFHYPKELQSAGIEGTVFLELWIDKEGNVINVILMESAHPDLDRIAVENAWKIKFSPAMEKDKPVARRMGFPITFKLK